MSKVGSSVKVSIHAPARGATEIGVRLTSRCSFNSRSREGSDSPTLGGAGLSMVFQFTLPRGERRKCEDATKRRETFQFTLPRGERPSGSCDSSLSYRFQFTLPRGERHLPISFLPGKHRVSIHAPARGATEPKVWLIYLMSCFNSRSREGSDAKVVGVPSVSNRFQFTLPRGERQRVYIALGFSLAFQFTLPRGERLR